MNYTIILFMIINSLQSCGYSIIQSIFPLLGKEYEISDTISGIIFSAFPIANTIIIPLVPYLLEKFHKDLIFIITLFTSSCMILIFGLISHSPSKNFFQISSFLIRFIQGIGVGISSTINYSLSVSICENEEEVNRNISLMELSYSIGLAIGPVMGTFLYESFGWEVPFFILAGLNLFSNLTVLNIKIQECEKSDYQNFFKAIFHWKILLTEIASIFLMATVNFYEPVFENYLIDNFGLNMKIASLFFDIQIFSFFISLSLIGHLIIKIGSKISISFGLFLGFIFVNFLGPISILPKTIYIIIIGLVLLGPSEAFVILPSIEDYMSTLINDLKFNKDYSNDLACTIFNFVSNLGDTIGPLLGGFFSDFYGFVNTCFIVSISLFICFITFTLVNLISYCKKISKKKKNKNNILDNNEPLIDIDFSTISTKHGSFIVIDNIKNKSYRRRLSRKMTFESYPKESIINQYKKKESIDDSS